MTAPSKLSIFDFNSHALRTIELDGEPWFVAADICSVLGIAHHRDAVSRLDSDERGAVLVDTPGGAQKVIAVNESGFYVLVLRSRKPIAKKFRKWVTSEVLPAIRKTGKYACDGAPLIEAEPWLDKDRREMLSIPDFLDHVAASMQKPIPHDIQLATGRAAIRIAHDFKVQIPNREDARWGPSIGVFTVSVLGRAWKLVGQPMFEAYQQRKSAQPSLGLDLEGHEIAA